MNTKIQEFLTTNNISVLTTLLPDNSPHSATLHYSHTHEPLELYFSTDRNSRKCTGLLNGEIVKASLVVGFSEQDWKTFQMDGVVQAVSSKEELEKIQKVHYLKHPKSEQFKDDPDSLFLKFIPSWWRYTDSTGILSSEE